MRAKLKLIVAALLGIVFLPSPSCGQGLRSASSKSILVLYWYNKDYPGNAIFDRHIPADLRSGTHGRLEYYSEYLEENRFPGENQSRFLRDYLRQKYAGRTINVVVANTPPTLSFLAENRDVLFPRAPIVFASTEFPSDEKLVSGPGATGIVYATSYRETLDLALTLHPGTEQAFIVSGGIDRDPNSETAARKELQGFEGRIKLNYLTNLPLGGLIERINSLPEKSVVLYVRQRARDQQGGILESQDILSLIAPRCKVPMYGMSSSNVGLGIVGGRVWTIEANASKMAEITMRVANGTPAADIPIERAPEVPMFDWRQLQRWGIPQDRLPPGSVIRFRELTVWQQYKGRIIAAVAVFLLQALLIWGLLLQRLKARRTQNELNEYKEHLEKVVQKRTSELVEARDEAMAASRSKTVFLAHMSHELRTPLNAILGFSGMVLRDPGLPDQHRKDLTIVGRSGQHLLGLIDDVLDMAKIETGSATVESGCFDLHILVNDSVNMLREHAQAKSLELILEVSLEVPQFVRSDPGKLRQVLTNLVGNALKYTEEGRVVVRVGASPADNSGKLVLIFDIEDTGIGIAEEDRTRIFDAFFQAAAARSRKGVGLGLSISRHFVELLGGSIQVESVAGRGSRFHVEVPIQTVEGSEVTADGSDVEGVAGLEPGQPEYRILIVEDHRENYLLLQRLLQTAGFHVRVAGDGEQAVEAFRMWRPQFIWMDLGLPVLSGWDAASRIRKLEGGGEVKIVAVTASAFSSQREEVLAAGFDDCLRKPYLATAIFECMARHLGVRYRYHTAPHAASALPDILRSEDLAALPEELRDELEQAVVSLDAKRIALVVRRVAEHNASLGGVLRRLADRFAYTRIHDAVRNCKTTSTQTSS
jgi:signal transduction histidine kinase/CheY-like chemotaxis protein